MNKYFFIFSLVFISAFKLQAQELGLGIKAGGDIAQLHGVSWGDDFSTYLTAGAFAYVRPFGRLGLRSELNFNQLHITTGQTFYSTFDNYIRSSSARESDFRFLEMGIPVLLEYRLIRPFNIEAGLQWSSILNINDYDELIRDKRSFFKQSYLSWVLGAQIYLTRKLSINARYIYGLNDINNTDVRERWRVGRYQFSLQYHLIRWGN